jgi:dUTP pyrophosphatase
MKIKLNKLHPLAKIPTYATGESAGFDLYALEDITIYPGTTGKVRTGLAFDIPKGYEVQIRARSGLSFKTMLRLANGVGTVDSDYYDEICVLLTNTAPIISQAYTIYAGDRIAQGVLAPVTKAEFEEVVGLIKRDDRGGGFGSTGV